MAFLIVSPGIDWPFASAIALRRRGLFPGSPPPIREATVISLMSFVKSLPRLASSAPFLCLIVAHFEWPLIRRAQRSENAANGQAGHRGAGRSGTATATATATAEF